MILRIKGASRDYYMNDLIKSVPEYEDILADINVALDYIRDELQDIARLIDPPNSTRLKDVIDGICQLILLTE